MKRILLACVVSVLCAGNSHAAIRMTFEGRMHDIAHQVNQALQTNPGLKGQKLAIGHFDGEGRLASRSAYGLKVHRRLGELLNDLRDDESEFVLAGRYFYTDGTGENSGLKVVRIDVTIRHLGKVVASIPEVEINETDNLFLVLGLTGVAPQGETLKTRNDAVHNALEHPDFEIVDGYRVASKAEPHLCVGILVTPTADGASSPFTPEKTDGSAWLKSISPGEYYAIELTNKSDFDAVANISIDGLNVVNDFRAEPQADGHVVKFPGVVVGSKKRLILKGWLQSTTPNGLPAIPFQTGVVATPTEQMKLRGNFGVITVQFREAAKASQKILTRCIDSSLGSALISEANDGSQAFKPEELTIGDNVLSTVSIRYNRPQ